MLTRIARAEAPSMIISKRAKGFPICLSLQHWFIIQTTLPWLSKMGMVTPEMVDAYTLVPVLEITKKDMGTARQHGWSPDCQSLYKSKTVRVRAEHLTGMIDILNLTAAYFPGGQLGGTLRTRAKRLQSVSALDQLADASR